MSPLPCRAGRCKHKVCTVAVSGHYFWAVSHMAAEKQNQSPPSHTHLLLSTFGAAPFLLCYSFYFTFPHLPLPLSFSLQRVSRNISTDPLQSVCITLPAISFPSLVWVEPHLEELSVIHEHHSCKYCNRVCAARRPASCFTATPFSLMRKRSSGVSINPPTD